MYSVSRSECLKTYVTEQSLQTFLPLCQAGTFSVGLNLTLLTIDPDQIAGARNVLTHPTLILECCLDLAEGRALLGRAILSLCFVSFGF